MTQMVQVVMAGDVAEAAQHTIEALTEPEELGA